MTMIPKIRFSEFEEEWKKVKLYNYATRITRKNTKLESNLPLTISSIDGLVSQIDYFNNRVASQNISGYYLIKNGEYAYNKSYSNGYPWGSVKRLNKYDMGVLSTLYIVFSINDSIDSDYFSHFFDTNLWHREVAAKAEEGARNHGLLNISVEDFFDINISTPTLSEQRRISQFFTLLDKTIRLEGERLASLQQVKAASLQSFFPQEGEKEPRVRFKGFSGEWKKVKIGEIFKERNEQNIHGEMLSVTMNNGIIKASENGRFDNSNDDKSHYKVVKIGDIAYNSMRMWQGASGCSAYEGIVSPAYTVLNPQEGIDSLFFSYLFKCQNMLKVFRFNSQGLTSDTWNLKYPTLSQIEIQYPESLAEQRALSAYFTNIDEQIRLVREKIEKMKKVKGACLEGMMV